MLPTRFTLSLLRAQRWTLNSHRRLPTPSLALFPHSFSTMSEDNWQYVLPTEPGIPPYSVFKKPIERSPTDEREYRVIELGNGLKATIVHDPKTDKAAASLDVAVGHLSDPVDMPGLAHFCEHLLFMGTKQFPQENEYQEYLAKNSGESNAYTSTSNTNYYFSVTTSALSGALERFSAFFHSPLFSPSCTSRELNAVDSEHKKNHQSDVWRIFQLNKHLSIDGHPWRKFGSGNRDSLSKAARSVLKDGVNNKVDNKDLMPGASVEISQSPLVLSENEADGGAVGREVRRRLIQWWSEEYCASRMHLCVLGKEPLDELCNLVSTLFSPIPNKDKDPLPMILQHPFGPNEKGTLVSVQTVMEFHAVEISFPLEYQLPLWRHKPINFISHFVGHEGPGSLHSYLKKKGWITSLSSGPQNLARGFSMFKITVHLTKEGFKNYRSIIMSSFKYLALLRSSKFEAFHQRDLVKLASIQFRFAEKKRPDSYATWIAEHMSWPIPPEQLLSGPVLIRDWEAEDSISDGEKKVRQYLESFRPDTCRVVLMAKGDSHETVRPGLQWEKEPWYKTEYHVERLDKDLIREAEGPNDISDLYLPGPNDFIPQTFDVDKHDVLEPSKRPHLIRQTPLTTLWHKKDDKFWVPKAHVMVDIRSPMGNSTAKAAVLTKLFADLVNDTLTEYAYDAELAGLTYSFSSTSTGLYASMNGYNDKMSILVQQVFEKAKELQVKPDRLAVMKEQVQRAWQNFFFGQSYTISDYFGHYLLTEGQWTIEEKLRELPSVTVEDVEEHAKALLSEVHLRMLICGNLYKDEAFEIANIIEKGLRSTPLPQSELNSRALILPPDSNHIWSLPVPNPNQANSALSYYLHYGPIVDLRLRVTAALLTQILSEPAFNVLRTQEQLGYVVFCSNWTLPGASEKGLRILVQSERAPSYLEQRVEAFLSSMEGKLEKMSLEEFDEHKLGLSKKWLEADKNLAEEAARYWTQVSSGHWDFLRHLNDVETLKSVTKDDVIQLFKTHIGPSAPTRAKLSVHAVSRKPSPKKVSDIASRAFVEKLRSVGIDLTENGWRQEINGSHPTVTEFTKYWQRFLKGRKGSESILDEIQQLASKYPVEGEDTNPTLPGAVYIENPIAFRKGLDVSIDPGPMIQWNDLPISKF